MPDIFRAFGFVFFFYSREHEPIRVHVSGKGGVAKYEWDGEKFTMVKAHDIKASDLKKITKMIDDNSDIIVKHWHKYF